MGSSIKHNGRELVEKGALLLDVRTREEFREQHIQGAMNLPVQELDARIAELGPTDRAIVVYCRSGKRSAAAAQVLKNAGYRVLDVGAMSNF